MIGFIVLIGWTVSLCYHFLAGIRHLAWDTGWGFDLPTMYRTGYAVLIGTVVLTVVIWIVALVVWL